MRAAALSLVLLAACSEAGVDPTEPDARPQADAQTFVDARSQPDARPPVDAAPPDAADPPPRYPADRTLSPITPSVARNLEAIVLRGDTLKDDVFAKVGDSITVATQFLHCFGTASVDLGGRAELQDTLEHFKMGMAGATTPYQRVSKAATVGWSADAVIAGESPVALDREIMDLAPRYAVVMFGSNDAAARSLFNFGPTLIDIVDRLAAQGVVPLMSTVPPNTQNADVGARIPRFNAVIRAIAQARQLPLMDYGREMALLPMSGLGGDGLHPNAFSGGACQLTAEGLQFGYNLRNLLVLQTLDRARGAVEGDAPPDPPAALPAVRGDGTYAVPFEINSFPWSDLRDSSLSTTDVLDRYPGCNAMQNESGPEVVYRLVLTGPTRVRAMVLDAADVDMDLHLLSGTTGESCVSRHDQEIVATLAAGTHYFVLDTFVPVSGQDRSGEYLFVVIEEEAP